MGGSIIFQEFVDLVEQLLEEFLGELGVKLEACSLFCSAPDGLQSRREISSSQDFVALCEDGSSFPSDNYVFNQVLAVDNFMSKNYLIVLICSALWFLLSGKIMV